MKRNSFLKLCLAVGSFASAPFSGFAKTNNKNRFDKGFKVNAGKDRFNESISLFQGDTFFCKVSTKDTDGDMYAFESTRLKKGGPPLHYHFEQDEWWYILEGEFLFKVGEETFEGKPGDSFFGPRQIPHAFAKTNEGDARMLIIFQPAGKMEAHFKTVSTDAYSKLSEEEKEKIREANGLKNVGPALTYDKTKL